MKIRLIRSEEVSKSWFRNLFDMLDLFKGPAMFIALKNDLQLENDETEELESIPSEREILSWEVLFGKCEEFRSSGNIIADEAVVLLTDHGNERNWFSSWDESGKRNFFIQASGWNKILPYESYYPVIHELASIVLALGFCDNLTDVVKLSHDPSRGCMFDYCRNKEDVQLKQLTGWICPDCSRVMAENKIDLLLVNQVFKMIDEVRSNVLFRDRFNINNLLSGMKIDLNKVNLIFTHLGNINVHLVPQEMIIYRLFLKYVDGLYLNEIKNYKVELKQFYESHSHEVIIAAIENSIQELIDRNNSLSEILSKIKKKITEAIGPELAEYYIIKRHGTQGRHKIKFQRDLLIDYKETYIDKSEKIKQLISKK